MTEQGQEPKQSTKDLSADSLWAHEGARYIFATLFFGPQPV